MKKNLLLLLSTLSFLVLPSCFQSDVAIHLNKDGSGTIVEETKFGAQMMAMMNQMAAGLGGDAKADPLKDMLSEDKAKARATELGKDVTFVKSEPVEKDGAKGARTTYAFKNINDLSVSTSDGMKNASPEGAPEQPGAKKEDPIKFNYADGLLTVKMPKKEQADAAKADAAKPDANQAENVGGPEEAMMKQMLADMRISIKLVIEPGIAESNATHIDGNTITLMEMDFGKLVNNADAFKKLKTMGEEKDPAAAINALKGIPGVKFEIKDEITVKVK
jgi:hypothetical protein